jgi:hypothetical protein
MRGGIAVHLSIDTAARSGVIAGSRPPQCGTIAGAPRRPLRARIQGMDPDYCIAVPPGFDDSDDEAQVHPMARRLFPGRTPAEVFAKAQQWVGEHDVRIVDVEEDEPAGA